MENTRIVTLGPAGDNVTSFEEAFGEYSEARGKGRRRRQKRRLERIANRAERKRARQAMRAEQQEARQQRKDIRKSRKAARKEMGDGPENEMDEQTAVETGNGAEATTEQGGGAAETRAEQGGGEMGGGSSESASSSQEEWGGAPPVMEDDNQGGASETTWGGTGSVYENDNNDTFGAPEGTGDDSGFDGVMGAEDRFFEIEAGANNLKISPAVKQLTRRIEWNKELVSRLMVKRAAIAGKNGDTYEIDRQISNRKARIAELEGSLNKYANFEGDYASADGNRPHKGMFAKRKREVMAGRRAAMRERRQLRRRKHTPVAKGLNPQFGPNKIVVPANAKSYADGRPTGLNGLDLQNDYDAPDARYVELSSNAEGDTKKKINWVGIGIGAAVAVVGIWAMKKYKVI